MSRISKSVAEEITNKLMVKLDEEIKNVEQEIKNILYGEALKLVPEDVKKLFKDKKEWIRYTRSSYFSFNSQHVFYDLGRDYPLHRDKKIVIKDEEICNILEILTNKKEVLIKKRRNLYSEVLNTLLDLSTTNKIKQYFPEAAIYIPEEKMEIAINISSTREKLNSI